MSLLIRKNIGSFGSPRYMMSDELFSTSLWTGDRFVRDIPNVPNPDAEDILVWIKGRSDASSHRLFDSARGVGLTISSDTDSVEISRPAALSAFNDGSFTIGADNITNFINGEFVGWSFKKAPKFFDVIKYTGDRVVGRAIPHDLGVQAGMVLVKRLDAAQNWAVQHVSRGGAKQLSLNLSTAETIPGIGMWGNVTATDTQVTVGDYLETNFAGANYIMYVFAHDPSPEGVIQCGQYTGNGTNSNFVNLETPWAEGIQYIMIKSATVAVDWCIFDTTRGLENDAPDKRLFADTSGVEFTTTDYLNITPTGFELKNAAFLTNSGGNEYIYMAIRAPTPVPAFRDIYDV